MKRLEGNPKQDGFRMPGEFERHSGTYMIWPERPDNWRLGAKPAQHVFTRVANAIGKYEPITMVVSRAQYDNARNMLADYVKVVEMSNDDSWMRDCGATFVIDDKGGKRAIDWKFNAGGGLVDGLYFPWDQDDKVAMKMSELEQVDRYRLDDFVLEGGSIHVDGEGTVMTTEECLLSEGRNSHLTKEQIEEVLYMGMEPKVEYEGPKAISFGRATYGSEAPLDVERKISTKGRTPKAPTKPMSKNEMKAKFTVAKQSRLGDGNE